MRADLHTYGLVSFSRFWRAWQTFPGAILTDEIYKIAKLKEIDLIALTSATEETPKGVNDRFGYILNEAQNQGINTEVRGNNFFIIQGELGLLGVLKSSLVPTIENNQRTDIFVLGDYLDFDCQKRRLTTKEAIKTAKNAGSLVFMKPSGLFGSEKSIEIYADSINGVFLSSEAPTKQNKETSLRIDELEKQDIKIPAIPVSGAHTIKGIGDGYIDLHNINIRTDNEEELKKSLTYSLNKDEFVAGKIRYASGISKLYCGIPFKLIYATREKLGMDDEYGLRTRK